MNKVILPGIKFHQLWQKWVLKWKMSQPRLANTDSIEKYLYSVNWRYLIPTCIPFLEKFRNILNASKENSFHNCIKNKALAVLEQRRRTV